MTPPAGSGVAPPAVYFLSDYGATDEFAGVVRAVLVRSAPGVPIVDLSHGVPPFDVRAGAEMLVRSTPHLGAGVVLAVVDPGVGTDRRGVAVGVAGRDDRPGAAPTWLVGPDNGLLVPAADLLGGAARAYVLARTGGTFDGRDVFAPAAAHLVRGCDPETIGFPVAVTSLVRLRTPRSESDDRGGDSRSAELVGAVVWIDRFGNVQLDLDGGDLERVGLRAGTRAEIELEEPADGTDPRHPHRSDARRVGSFAELAAGELGVLIDSSGRVALVEDRASAAEALGLVAHGQHPTVRIRPVPGRKKD